MTEEKRQEKIKEIQHLNVRIRNVQESIQLSTSLSNPQIWQDNCLNAVKNCVNEWRNIVSFYQQDDDGNNNNNNDDDDDDDDDREEEDYDHDNIESIMDLIRIVENELMNNKNDKDEDKDKDKDKDNLIVERIKNDNDNKNGKHDELMTNTALKIYGLIQMSLQVGPLKGSNPGYFKRCGVDVAKIAKSYLHEFIEDKDENHDENHDNRHRKVLQCLKFTERQEENIKKWLENTEKAISSNKPPSKSALKMQNAVNKVVPSKKKGKKKK